MVILFIFDIYYFMSDNAMDKFFAFITLVIHCSFAVIGKAFNDIRANEFRGYLQDEDPWSDEAEKRLVKIKLGGGFTCCAATVAIVFRFYFVFQILLGVPYVYFVFFKFRNFQSDDDF